MSKERQEAGGGLEAEEERTVFDFSGQDNLVPLEGGRETIFVNAAWMTMKKRAVKDRNYPFQIVLDLGELHGSLDRAPSTRKRSEINIV
jgi:hypothetical protein